jgi:hypothetical protein
MFSKTLVTFTPKKIASILLHGAGVVKKTGSLYFGARIDFGSSRR